VPGVTATAYSTGISWWMAAGRCPAWPARCASPRSTALPRNQLIALDALLGVQRDHGPHEEALLVRAAGVDGQRAPELGDALSLVDVAVQRQQRTVVLDRAAHGRRA